MGTERDGDVHVELHPPACAPRGHRRAPRLVGVAAVSALALVTSGCTGAETAPGFLSRGWLPGAEGTTSTNDIVDSLWVGSWIAALAVGVIVWGLTIWVVVRYRRRKNETGLPPQLRYNVPMEIMYTLVPLFMVGVLFFYTARDQQEIESRYEDPQTQIEVVGKRWAWDFNYTDADVYETSKQIPMQAGLTQDEVDAEIPVLYLPVGRTTELTLRSRDVIHSFYVPAFSYKKDMIPGRTNLMSFTPEREGVYAGRCAELCGEYHSAMLFKVAVVSQDEYDQQMAALRQRGQTGALEVDLGPSDLSDQEVEDQIGNPTGYDSLKKDQ